MMVLLLSCLIGALLYPILAAISSRTAVGYALGALYSVSFAPMIILSQLASVGCSVGCFTVYYVRVVRGHIANQRDSIHIRIRMY